MTEYGYSVEVPAGYDEAVIRTRLAMKGEGFSILTEAHVGGMFPEAGVDRQYLILGVWNSQLSTRNLGDDLRVAVHLPCNVVVQETGASAIVAALDPSDVIDTEDQVGTTSVEPSDARAIVDAARDALTRMLDRVATSN